MLGLAVLVVLPSVASASFRRGRRR
jgi:hypothetical protein